MSDMPEWLTVTGPEIKCGICEPERHTTHTVYRHGREVAMLSVWSNGYWVSVGEDQTWYAHWPEAQAAVEAGP